MKIVSLAPYVPHRQIPHAGGVFLYHYLAGLAARVMKSFSSLPAPWRTATPQTAAPA